MTSVQELQLLMSSLGEDDEGLHSFSSFFELYPLPLLGRLFVSVRLSPFRLSSSFPRATRSPDILLSETSSCPATLPVQARRRRHCPAKS